MLWVVEHIPSGMYFTSEDVLVKNKIFAKSFNSRKAAREFIYRNECNIPRTDFRICENSESEETVDYNEKAGIIMDRILELAEDNETFDRLFGKKASE